MRIKDSPGILLLDWLFPMLKGCGHTAVFAFPTQCTESFTAELQTAGSEVLGARQ